MDFAFPFFCKHNVLFVETQAVKAVDELVLHSLVLVAAGPRFNDLVFLFYYSTIGLKIRKEVRNWNYSFSFTAKKIRTIFILHSNIGLCEA